MAGYVATIDFARQLYGQRLNTWWAGRVRRDPLARLRLREGRADPYSVHEEMRRAGPLLPTRLGNWSTTSHAVCRHVLRSRDFGVRDPTQRASSAEDDFDLSFLGMDPPDHTRLRRLAAPAFTPRAIAGYRDTIETTVGRLVDRAAERGRFDLVADLAAPLPIAVITELLGIPDADVATFRRYGTALGGALDGLRSLGHAREVIAANVALQRMFEDLFALREREPGGDVISALVAGRGDGLRPAEMVPLCTLLLIAGFETTVNLVSNAVRALLDHPEQWQALVRDPGLAPGAVEEVLRWEPPVQETARIAFTDTDLAGRTVRRGQWVVTLLAAANRDPDVFPEPARFDITRTPGDHLSFSAGPHYCLGAPLARLEAEVALRTLAVRLPRLSRAGAVRMRPTTTIRGPQRLPVAG